MSMSLSHTHSHYLSTHLFRSLFNPLTPSGLLCNHCWFYPREHESASYCVWQICGRKKLRWSHCWILSWVISKENRYSDANKGHWMFNTDISYISQIGCCPVINSDAIVLPSPCFFLNLAVIYMRNFFHFHLSHLISSNQLHLLSSGINVRGNVKAVLKLQAAAEKAKKVSN